MWAIDERSGKELVPNMELKRWHLRDAPFDVLKNLTEVILRIPLPVMLGAASYLRTREKYLYHIDPCRFACNDDGFNFSEFSNIRRRAP